jgi:hypothetical protein
MNAGKVDLLAELMPKTSALFDRVDALKVLRALVADCREQGDHDIADGIDKVIAALNELIEASRNANADLAYRLTHCHEEARDNTNWARLHSALARIGGKS